MVVLVIGFFLSILICTRIDVFLLDGMREDFFLDGEVINKTYFPRLTVSAFPSVKKTVLTETPTYTTNCLHAMYTGRVTHPLCVLLALAPSMYTITGGPREEPRVLKLLLQRGYSLSVSGDDTLAKMFPSYFSQSQTAYSFSIGDYDTVDNIVLQSLQDLWASGAAVTNQFSVYHFLGADHIAHSEGLLSATLRERYNRYDNLIDTHLNFLHNMWTKGDLDSYVVIILSDHGMTDKGTHGGFSVAETHTPFLLFTSSESLREGLETRVGQLIPQRHILLHVLSKLFLAETGAEIEIEATDGAPSSAVSSVDICIIIAYTILLAILSTIIIARKRPISSAILMCQFLCAVAARFAHNETVPLVISLAMELIWKTRSDSNEINVRYGGKNPARRHSMYRALLIVSYGAWIASLAYITRGVYSVTPAALMLVIQTFNARAELRHILLRLLLNGMGHTELFSYRLPSIYLSNRPKNSANPWSCAAYIFLTDGLPTMISGSIYDFTSLATLIFSSLLFRWHPLYNSICVSRLIMGIVTAILSLSGVIMRRVGSTLGFLR